MSRFLSHCLVILTLSFPIRSAAQTQSLTLVQAVQEALNRYPAVQISLEQVSAAAAGINLSRTSYLPRADLVGQVNRGTRNNVFGLLPSPGVIPPISGPVLGTNDLTNVWGSALGVQVSWEPFDFGQRRAGVELAQSVRKTKEVTADVTRLQVASAAADSFLTILAAQQTALAAQAGVDRARAFNQVVEVLVRNELRPGVDAARTRAELALAENQLILAQQAVEVARASLAQLLGISPAAISLQPGPLLQLPSEPPLPPDDLARHPLAVEQRAVVDEVQARERVLDRSYFPTFRLQAATSGRGSGARTDGSTGGGAAGLGPNTGNWAAAFTVSFPVMDLPALRARQEIELYQERAESARYEKVLQDLSGQLEKAKAQLRAASRITENTPTQLEAARAAEQQATTRYRAGLGNFLEVADAQRLLTQAEIDDSLAKLGVWRALLVVAASQGDLQPFLSQTGR